MITIERFDRIEFDILELVIGYYNDETHAERMEIMMREGIYIQSPRSEWPKSGWKITEYGKEYRAAFFERLYKRHGHTWIKDDYNGEVDYFATSGGYHNGPKCEKCGFSFCQHCDSEFEIDECTEREAVRPG